MHTTRGSTVYRRVPIVLPPLVAPSSYRKIGFYIGRRMHRPGLAELEPLVAHAERLSVDGVDGQDYLR